MQTSSSKHQVFGVSFLIFALLQVAISNAYAGGLAGTVPSNSAYNPNSGPSISDVYSDIDMRVRLATKTSTAACIPVQCEENRDFNARVSAIGGYLNKIALELYPEQDKVIKRMVFSVADKQEAGTASNNKGQIVVLRGVQYLQLTDDALGFVIAREMAHVMAGHHATNTSTKLIISALVSVLFPAVAIIGASSAAAQASTATTLITSAASTATSMVGSEVAMAQMKPTQLSQADEIARTIMEKANWDMRSVESVLTQDEPPRGSWMLDLQTSRSTLQGLIEKEDAEVLLLEEEDSDLVPENISSDGEASDEVDPEVIIMPLHEAAIK
ncbi:MAG TPA: M48 family metalloprotease [Methylotenera sp.]|nr:M48 family metalloprotease [Methylotenera sp.]